jgi:hypothetical protein
MPKFHWPILSALCVLLCFWCVACAAPAATPLPPSPTPVPPSATPVPPTATPIPPSATPPPTVDVAAIQTAAAATVVAQVAANQTATEAARPTNTLPPTATFTPQPTATFTPAPTAVPQKAAPTAVPQPTAAPAGTFSVTPTNMRYEQWGRPDPRVGCQQFNDKSPVRKFNLELVITNNGSETITDWYPRFWGVSGQELIVCYYGYGGGRGYPTLPPGATRTVTFAAFCELNDAVSSMSVELGSEKIKRCFNPAGALVGCP